VPSRLSRDAAIERWHVPPAITLSLDLHYNRRASREAALRQTSSYTQCDARTAVVGARLLDAWTIGEPYTFVRARVRNCGRTPGERKGACPLTAGRPTSTHISESAKRSARTMILETASGNVLAAPESLSQKGVLLLQATPPELATSDRPHPISSARAELLRGRVHRSCNRGAGKGTRPFCC